MPEDPSPKPHIRLLATYGLPFVWFGLLAVLLNVTNPLENGPISVLAILVVLYLLISGVLYALVSGVMRSLRSFGFKRPFNFRLTYYLISVISLGPVFILALNTLGQIELKDIILVIVLLALGCFYVLRRGAPTPS